MGQGPVTPLDPSSLTDEAGAGALALNRPEEQMREGGAGPAGGGPSREAPRPVAADVAVTSSVFYESKQLILCTYFLQH